MDLTPKKEKTMEFNFIRGVVLVLVVAALCFIYRQGKQDS
jgi:hypothetical protein